MGESFSDHRGTAKQREGLSRRRIIKACEDTLRQETLSAFDDPIRQGKVRYIGCSNFSA